MSVHDWANYNERKTRKREAVREEIVSELELAPDPIHVQEHQVSDTFIGKLKARLKLWPEGTP